MFLLDTNVVSELMRDAPNQVVLAWLDQHHESSLFTSAITHCEIELGLALIPQGKKQRQLTQQASELLRETFAERCLGLTAPCAPVYAQILAERKASGQPISTEDAMIAAIAVAHGVSLVTRNTKDFQGIEGLALVNPWQSTAA
jgi:toxin FitB